MLAAVEEFLSTKGLRVIGTASDGNAAASLIAARRPAIALVDLRMPRLGGIDVARRAAETSPETAIVFYTGYGDIELLNDALEVGARGFVLKEAPLEDLVAAIRQIAEGTIYVDPVLSSALVRARAGTDHGALSERERDVLCLLADGLTNQEIGRRLFIAPDTVRTHVRHAMQKLGADTRTAAVAEALRQKLIK